MFVCRFPVVEYGFYGRENDDLYRFSTLLNEEFKRCVLSDSFFSISFISTIGIIWINFVFIKPPEND